MGRSWNKYAAELVGTYILVLLGVGSAVLAGPEIGNVGVAFAFGLALLAMVYAIGPISGCHINPAVTLGLWLGKKCDARDVPGYVVAQALGAFLAAATLLLVAKGVPAGYDAGTTGFGANGYGSHSPGHYGLTAVLVAEVALTFVLVFTVLGATDVKAPVGFAGLAIGLVLTAIHLLGIPLDNLSVNPARSFGPALFVGGWAMSQLWAFVVAPLAGGAIAAALYNIMHRPVRRFSASHAERALPDEQVDRA